MDRQTTEPPKKRSLTMQDQFQVFDVVLKQRGRSWRWCVCTTEQKAVIQGSEASRRAAKYKADRALFQLLCAPYPAREPGSFDGTVRRVQSRSPQRHNPIVG